VGQVPFRMHWGAHRAGGGSEISGQAPVTLPYRLNTQVYRDETGTKGTPHRATSESDFPHTSCVTPGLQLLGSAQYRASLDRNGTRPFPTGGCPERMTIPSRHVERSRDILYVEDGGQRGLPKHDRQGGHPWHRAVTARRGDADREPSGSLRPWTAPGRPRGRVP